MNTDLKAMSVKDLEALSNEIAIFLSEKTAVDVETIMRNISVLEITLALHKVFNIGEDALIFDDGKQSLVHQIITGRSNQLKLRSKTNMYLDRHHISDFYQGGKIGEGLAFGLAHALSNEHSTFVVLDDYSLNYGTTYEALLQISKLKPDLTIVLIDEQQSLLRHYSTMDTAIKSVRISKVYTELKKDMKFVLDSNPLSRPILSTLSRVRDAIKETVLEPTIFTQFGIDYHGPIDGQNLNDLIKIFELSKKFQGPNIIHVQTRVKEKKQRKLIFPAFKTDSDRPDTYADYIETLDSVLSLHDDLVIINDAHLTSDQFKEFMFLYPEQYHTTSGSVQVMIAMISALIKNGKKGVISLSSRLAPDILMPLNNQFDLKNLPITVIIRDCGLSSSNDPMNHGIHDFVLASNSPNVSIVMGKDMNEASYLLEEALNSHKLTILRIPNASEKINIEQLNSKDIWDEILPVNKDSKGVIITFGPAIKQFQRKIEINNLDISLINARTVNSVDVDIMNKIQEFKLDVLIYNCEGRFDLLSHSIFRYFALAGKSLNVKMMNIETVNLEHASKDLKNTYHLGVDDAIKYFI